MRLDKFLKVSRLIKRRTVANEACDAGRVLVNGKVAKASLKNEASPPSPEVMWSIRVKIGLKTEQTRSLLSCYLCVFNPKQACDAAIAVGRVPPGQPQRLQPHAVQLPLPPERHGQGGQPDVNHSQRLVCRRLGRFSSTFRETP